MLNKSYHKIKIVEDIQRIKELLKNLAIDANNKEEADNLYAKYRLINEVEYLLSNDSVTTKAISNSASAVCLWACK